MRSLIEIKPLSDFRIECLFDDGTRKIADMTPFLKTEVFKPLNNPAAFVKISNRIYFIEWSEHEVDISADTLWHIAQ